MTGRRFWSEWTRTAPAVGVCAAACFVYVRAGQAGYDANAIGLLGCQALRCLLLLLAWWTVGRACRTARHRDGAAAARFNVRDIAGLLLLLPGCVGCYPIWPAVPALLAFPLIGALVVDHPTDGKPTLAALLRAGVTVLLFTLTWYLCASTTREALAGLGARIDDRAGADRLKAWATEALAAHQRGQLPARVERGELPDFVDDLLGPSQGVRYAVIDNAADPNVTLFTGGSAYHFEIRIEPQDVQRDPPGWLGAVEWRPGILLSTGGK